MDSSFGFSVILAEKVGSLVFMPTSAEADIFFRAFVYGYAHGSEHSDRNPRCHTPREAETKKTNRGVEILHESI